MKEESNSADIRSDQIEKLNLNELWHERFCHVNNECLVNTSKKESVIGLPLMSKSAEECISCKLETLKEHYLKQTVKLNQKLPSNFYI